MAALLLACWGCSAESITALAYTLENLRSFPDSIVRGYGMPPTAYAPNELVVGDTIVRGTIFVDQARNAQSGQPATPMRLLPELAARRAEAPAQLVNLELESCQLRLHRTSDLAGSPVWRSGDEGSAASCPRPPGAQPLTAWAVPDVLGDSLADGRYHFAYSVRLVDGRTLDFAAGSGYLTSDTRAPSTDHAALRMSAHSEIAGQGPRTLRVAAVVRNAGDRIVEVMHGACTPGVRLRASSLLPAIDVWAGMGEGHGACTDQAFVRWLAPGDSILLQRWIPLYDMFAAGVRTGRHQVTASIELGTSVGQSLGIHEVAAGTVELRREPDPLPSARDVGPLSIVAASRMLRGESGADTLRTLVLVTNTADTTVLLYVARDCPVHVLGYPTASARDVVPLETPDWSSAPACVLTLHRFQLAPGASWVFDHDVPKSELLERGGPGKHWLTALLWLDRSVPLAAGEIQVEE